MTSRPPPSILRCNFPSAASTNEISRQTRTTKRPRKRRVFKDFPTGCGDTQHRMLAIGRTSDSPVRRIATLTMTRDVGSNTSSSDIPPNLRYSATFCDAAADGFGITSHWPPTVRRLSRRDKSGCDELPMFAHATKALMSRLPTVNG